MKKYLAFGLVLGLAIGALTIHRAQAAPERSTTIISIYESLGVAAGAAITSPVITSAKYCSSIGIFADNSGGGSSRTLNIDWLGPDGTTILYRRAVTVTNGTRGAVLVSPTATSATASGETVVPAMTGERMQFTLAAAGAAAGSLEVICK